MGINIDSNSSDAILLADARTNSIQGEKEKVMEDKQLVLVKWRDILQTSDWTPANEVFCHTFQSIGWLISKDENEIKIGGTLVVKADDPQGTPFGITAFPIGCVEELKVLGMVVDKPSTTDDDSPEEEPTS